LKLSVIIPTLNEYQNLISLVPFFEESIKNNVEIIIADSILTKDSTSSIGFPYIYLQTGVMGRAAQMNLGAKKATGDILVFLHADVKPPVSFAEDIRDSISKGNDFGFFAYQFVPSSFMLDINAGFTGRKGLFAGGGDQIHFMTRSLFMDMGGYVEKYTIMEDFDFMRRFKKLQKPYKIIQTPALVSSRKYLQNSWLRVNAANLLAFVLFLLNTNPPLIKKWYYKILR
jgi:glycosyltransferase involved in cell wall biosynthesis